MARSEQNQAEPEEQAYARHWIRDNLHLFAPLALEGYTLVGRGAILVNVMELILRRHYEEGHPFNYHAPNDIWMDSDELSELSLRANIRNLLQGYVPGHEFILVIMRGDESTVHRVPLPPAEEMDPEIRGAYVNAEREERHNRLTCTDFWARPYRLASPYTAEWLYRVA